MVKTIRPAGNLGSAQSDDGYTAGVWHDCPLDEIREGLRQGTLFEFNFDSMPKTPATTEGNYSLFTQFSDTGGTIAPPATGFRGWDFGSDGDNEGASIRARAMAFQIDRTAGGAFWWEARIKTSTIADAKHNILTGMLEDVALTAVLPITAAGAIADVNGFGFRRTEAVSGGALLDTWYKANGVTAVTVQAGAVPLVADTYVNIGMKYVPSVDPFVADVNYTSLGKYNLFFYANGLRLATYKLIPTAQGTDFPNDVRMSPFFAVLNATGTTPGTSAISRLRVAQLNTPAGV